MSTFCGIKFFATAESDEFSEFLEIPFFKQVNDLIWVVWKQYKSTGYITTPIEKRQISMDNVERVTATKLFNYYIQAVETEVSVRKMASVIEYLKDKTSKLILYTYDSMLTDIHIEEIKEVVPKIRMILEEGNFPVKVKYGSTYGKMKTI